MVSNGDVLTYIGTWSTGGVFQTVNDLVSAVTTDLLAQGIAVRNSSVDQSLGSIIGSAGWGGTFRITLTLQVENGLGFASPDDVLSIVRGAVIQEGSTSTGESIPYQNNQTTGEPDTSAGGGNKKGCIAGTNNDLSGSFSLACWFSNLTTSGLSTVGMLVLVAIVGLILLSKAERTVGAA